MANHSLRPNGTNTSGGAQNTPFRFCLTGRVACRPDLQISRTGRRVATLLLDDGTSNEPVPVSCWGALADRAQGFRSGLLVEASGFVRGAVSATKDGRVFHSVGLNAQRLVKLEAPAGEVR